MQTKDKYKQIEFYGFVPDKNRLFNLILFTKFPLLFPGIKDLVKKFLPHCKNIDFVYGFRCFYGNIYAEDVFLCDAFFVDYAPIYIGAGSRFSFDNMIITGSHDLKDFKRVTAKPIHIGKNVWITSRCIILGGVTIGDNSIIAAGSVVTRDIPANCLAAGNPARVIRHLKKMLIQ